MGNCCNGFHNDFDILNFRSNKDKKNKNQIISSNDIKSQANTNEDINKIKESNINDINNSPSKLFISKKKLKLIIKQSKCLMEGKEYIINSLGRIDSKNKCNDGLTIFGDENVTIKSIYNLNFNIQTNTRTDFVFPKEESDTNQNHAEIRYDKTLDLYQIKSLRGNGCFLKIENRIVRILFNLSQYSIVT